jgi:predicted O-methyltransferase YrrM
MNIEIRMTEHEAARWRPWIEGWSEDILPWYDAVARALPQNAVVVELGTARGRSALFLAERLTLLERGDVQIWCVDTWEGAELGKMLRTLVQYPEVLQATNSSGLEDVDVVSKLRLVRCESTRASWLFADGAVDVVFVDADHSYDGVRADVATWLPKLKPGGLLAGHDYSPDWPGCMQAVDELFAVGQVEHPTRSVWQYRIPEDG